ncbi:L-histidine N(alpha)-methyltransferase [Solimonas fluminis]|uniref:L-histidine N(alpha)-methyltransferase n=1 Tax=Solimonas fluminis TaxID=2086571 RepID=UPI0013FDC88B|nr:L-histidine N(alpha)-methyltransferase [Solimonas fluminis]
MSDEELVRGGTASAPAVEFLEHPDLAEIVGDLSRPQKRLPTRLLYDERGSHLFERICETRDYYVTRAELEILSRDLDDIAGFAGAGAGVIEPGAGCGCKTRELLSALEDPRWYAPLDIDPSVLWRCREAIRQALPHLPLVPVCADFTQPWCHAGLPVAERRLLFFPGSTVGNFEPVQAQRLLGRFRDAAGPGGRLILGVDLRKNAATLRRAYDDGEGITASFNLNLLARLNREHGADFDTAAFEHLAVYDKALHRIEMHLRSRRDQWVRIGGCRFHFAAGETIHTESSHKYLPGGMVALAAAAGWQAQKLWMDPQRRFALMGFEAAPRKQPNTEVKEDNMAATKKSSGGRRYGKGAARTVASAMRRRKRGTLKSGPGGKGGTVRSRKQAIAIGLSEARRKGAKVPPKKAGGGSK